jgi:LysM repeat protein
MRMSFWQKCFVLLLGVAILGSAACFARIAFRPPELGRYKSIPWVEYVHPSIKKLEQAQVLAREGKSNEARDIVVKALVTEPKSPVTRELRDLLGDINAQIFFSKEPSPRKTEYTVQPGDALSSIARKLDSSPDAIIRINNLDSTLIRPGEKLLVPQLDFSVTVNLPRNRVVVHDSRGFFTQYPITSAQLPHTRQPTIETKVAGKSFWENGKPMPPGHEFQKQGSPRIDLERKGYVLYGVEEQSDAATSQAAAATDDNGGTSDSADANRPPQGIAMQKNDLADIELLTRKGTPVTIVLNQEDTSRSQASNVSFSRH